MILCLQLPADASRIRSVGVRSFEPVRYRVGATHRENSMAWEPCATAQGLPFGPSGLHPLWLSYLQSHPCHCHWPRFPSRMVMVGNSISYEAYTHNQSLPNNTSLDMLAMRPRWFFWCFGGATLPTVTNGYHLSSCSHWFFWPYGHRLYHRLPTLTTHGIWVATNPSQPLPLRSPA